VSVEERVTRALHDEADRIDVDVARLHAATRDRLARRPGSWLRSTPALAASVAVALVLVGGITFTTVLRGVGIGVLDRMTGVE
jgi:hypothetical protein